jgi:hypothetical protein
LIESDDEECLIKESKLKKAKDDSKKEASNVDDISQNSQAKTIQENQISENTRVQTPEKKNLENNLQNYSVHQKNSYYLKFWGLSANYLDQEKKVSYQIDERQVSGDGVFGLKAKYVRLGNLIGDENSRLEFDPNEAMNIKMSGNYIFSIFNIL